MVALIAALAVIAVLWGMQLEAHRRLREQEDSSQRLLARLNQLEVDNLRLSNVVAQANTPLADMQLAELAKLQDEVRALRKRTNDLQKLQAEIRQLRTKLTSMSSNAPPDVPAADIYPRDSWAFAGYDTPEAALQSLTWAISEGDEDAYLAGLSPALRGEMQSQLADGSFADTGPMGLSDATGYRIVGRQSISDSQEIIIVYMDGEANGNEVPLTFEKTPEGWRVSGENSDQGR
jgi:hypothetical protein